MRGHGTLSRVSSLLTACFLGTTTSLLFVAPGPAHAAAPCGEIAPGTRIKDVPWAQRRLAPERVSPLADGRGVTVAVIDSGVDDDHPQLRGRVRKGANFLGSAPDGTRDCVGHGTGVASIIAAGPPPSGVAFRGLAPGVTIVPVRVSEQQTVDGKTQGDAAGPSDFAAAIRWAVDQGKADVINLSVVLVRDEPAVRSAITHALEKDVVVVAAAGNAHGQGDPRPYPAAYDGVLGVGAIGPDSVRQEYSQIGEYVDVMAPGGGVTVAWPDGRYTVQDGTSYATPFVSATAALIRQYRPRLRASEVIRRIVATADPSPGGRKSDAYGNGVVNPYRALTETVAREAPERAKPLAPDTVDEATAAALRHRAQTRRESLLMAAGGGGIAVLVLVGALVLPRGVRRRWRPAEPT